MALNFLKAVDAAKKTKHLLDDIPPPGRAELELWKSANKPQPRPPLTARPAVARIPSELTPRSARVARRPLSSAPAGPEEPGASFGFRGVKMPAGSRSDEAAQARAELDGARGSILSHWTAAYAGESDRFASTAVYVELRLRQALAASEALGAPNLFRCAVVCDAWERVAPLLGRYESLLSLVWRELLRCMFADYDESLPGSDARSYARRQPFFVEVQKQRKAAAEQAATISAWGAQRQEAMEALGERSKTISHTLSVWNRALASAGAGSVVKAEALEGQVGAGPAGRGHAHTRTRAHTTRARGRSAHSLTLLPSDARTPRAHAHAHARRAQLRSLADQLEEANSTIADLTDSSYSEPLLKVVRDFAALPPARQPECLRRLLLGGEGDGEGGDGAAPTRAPLLVLVEMAPADGGAMVGRMLGSVHLGPDEAAEATGAALGCVSAEVRAKGVELGLLGHSSPAQVGATLATILTKLHGASVRLLRPCFAREAATLPLRSAREAAGARSGRAPAHTPAPPPPPAPPHAPFVARRSSLAWSGSGARQRGRRDGGGVWARGAPHGARPAARGAGAAAARAARRGRARLCAAGGPRPRLEAAAADDDAPRGGRGGAGAAAEARAGREREGARRGGEGGGPA